MSRLLIQFLHLSKSFDSFQLFDDISLSINQGEVLALIGENGAGKSSICNILKSVCGKKPFVYNQIPDEICLKFDDGEYKFPNGSNESILEIPS